MKCYGICDKINGGACFNLCTLSKREISDWLKESNRNHSAENKNNTERPSLTQAQKIAQREIPTKPLPSGEGLEIQFTI